MIYECDQCSEALPPGVMACPNCDEAFDEPVPTDATGWIQDEPLFRQSPVSSELPSFSEPPFPSEPLGLSQLSLAPLRPALATTQEPALATTQERPGNGLALHPISEGEAASDGKHAKERRVGQSQDMGGTLVKICPRCSLIAPLDADVCRHCRHRYRTQFVGPRAVSVPTGRGPVALAAQGPVVAGRGPAVAAEGRLPAFDPNRTQMFMSVPIFIAPPMPRSASTRRIPTRGGRIIGGQRTIRGERTVRDRRTAGHSATATGVRAMQTGIRTMQAGSRRFAEYDPRIRRWVWRGLGTLFCVGAIWGIGILAGIWAA